MIGAVRADDEALGYNLYAYMVRVEFRSEGIGRALWQRLWTDLRARHAVAHQGKPILVSLCTGIRNPIRAFYEREGFRRLGPPACISDPTLQSP